MSETDAWDSWDDYLDGAESITDKLKQRHADWQDYTELRLTAQNVIAMNQLYPDLRDEMKIDGVSTAQITLMLLDEIEELRAELWSHEYSSYR